MNDYESLAHDLEITIANVEALDVPDPDIEAEIRRAVQALEAAAQMTEERI